jgi:hypothetical protein
MRTEHRLTRFASAAAWLGLFGVQAGTVAAAELTRAELVARVVGNTIHYHSESDDVFEFLAPDGVIRGTSRVHGAYFARWRILDNDAMCFEHDDPMASGCVAVVLCKGLIEYHRRDGVVEGPFPFLKGNPRKL